MTVTRDNLGFAKAYNCAMTQNSRLSPIPARLDFRALRNRAAALVPNAGTVALLANVRKLYPREILETDFPGDRELADIVTKAESNPTSISNTGALTTLAVPSFFASLGPASALSPLLSAAGFQYIWDKGSSYLINIASLLSDPTAGSFPGEGQPIPVRTLAVGDNALARHVLKSISVFSRETFQHSTPNILTTVQAAVTENTNLAGEVSAFDANAATAARPPGLRFGIAATPGVSANANTFEAMKEDVRLILTTLGPISGNAPVILIASPSQGWALKLMAETLPFTVLISSSVADGVVIGIASNALAVAYDASPTYDVADTGVLHFDTVPAPINVGGLAASKSLDLWQSDLIALKVSLGVSWGLRSPGGLVWLQNVVW